MSEPDPPETLPAPDAPAPSLSRGKSAAILVALLLGLLLGALDNFIVATVLPNIAQDLSDVDGQVFVVTSYLIAQTVAIPIFGKLSDRFGRRSFYLLGLAIFMVGSALSGFSQNLNELIAFRAVQGIGSGAFFTVVFSIIADLFPPKEAARLAGVLSGVFGIAIVAGPLIGSYIVDHTTWRWIFFVNLPVGVAAVALVLSSMGALRPKSAPRTFDSVGAALLSVWVAALIFPLVEIAAPVNAWAWTDPRSIGLLAAATALAVVFFWVESRAIDPLVPLQYFRTRLVAAASGVNFLRGAILVVVVTYIPILVHYGLAGSTDTARDVLYAFMVPMIAGAAVGGVLVSRSGYRLPTATGLAFATLGCLFLAITPTVPPIFRVTDLLIPVGLVGALIPLGFGVGLTFAPTQLAIQYSVRKEDVGSGSSLVWFLGNLGGSIVLSVLGSYEVTTAQGLSNAVPPPADPTQVAPYIAALHQATAQAIQNVWWAVVGVAVAGLLFALVVQGVLPSTTEAETGSEVAPAPPLAG